MANKDRSVPASSVGAPHQRDRIFILAYPINFADRTIKGESGEEERIQGISRKARCTRMSCRTSDEISNTNKPRCEGKDSEGTAGKSRPSKRGPDVPNSRCDTKRSSSRENSGGELHNQQNDRDKVWSHTTDCGGVWAVEPELGRVAHGVPCRVDRIKCLGNAVVPQVAEVFAKAIKGGEDD